MVMTRERKALFLAAKEQTKGFRQSKFNILVALDTIVHYAPIKIMLHYPPPG